LREILYTNAFAKDLKKVKSYPSFNGDKFKGYVDDLANGNQLPMSAKNHKLSKSSPKEYKGMYDFHISPDICVVYNITPVSIKLIRIGKHNNLGLTEDI
jgi:mRNA interferase YafQ